MIWWILIFIGLISILTLSIIVRMKTGYYKYDLITYMGITISLILLIIIPIILIESYTSNISELQDFKAVRNTVKTQRLNELSDYERIGLTRKIVEANEWLGRKKYWNQYSIFNPLIPEEVNKLKPIK